MILARLFSLKEARSGGLHHNYLLSAMIESRKCWCHFCQRVNSGQSYGNFTSTMSRFVNTVLFLSQLLTFFYRVVSELVSPKLVWSSSTTCTALPLIPTPQLLVTPFSPTFPHHPSSLSARQCESSLGKSTVTLVQDATPSWTVCT